MSCKKSLLITLSLVLTISANPVVVIRDNLLGLQLTKRINSAVAVSGPTLVKCDRARLYGRANVPITNGLVSYTANVTIGSPPTEYHLLVDTGSSNSWVGASTPYHATSTSIRTNNSVVFKYGSGNFSGTEFIDRINLGSGLVIDHQGLGVANESSGFQGVDGILGLGPTDLTIGSLSPESTTPIPTVTDNLFAQGTIHENLVAVSLEPANSESDTNGVITFGGVDQSKFTGEIHFTPRTKVQNSSLWWGIDQTLTYGKSTALFANSTAGIVDTGTTLLLLRSDAFALYQNASGGVLDDDTGLLSFTADQFKALESLFFHINGVTFELTPNAQIWPRKFNVDIGGTSDGIYSIISDLGVPPDDLVPAFNAAFVNGMAFLERFYAVFDTANDRIGLATTKYTYANIN